MLRVLKGEDIVCYASQPWGHFRRTDLVSGVSWVAEATTRCVAARAMLTVVYFGTPRKDAKRNDAVKGATPIA